MKPFLKWVGAKNQLLEQINNRLPEHFNRYFEPFIGAGAVLFDLKPKDAVINDMNAELINCYRQIKENVESLINSLSRLDRFPYVKETYYWLREKFNQKIIEKEYDTEMAALFIFLNKHAFNGVYRINGKGLFNVPWNQKLDPVKSFDKDNLIEISEYLNENEISIMTGDFAEAVKEAKKGDFVLLDPPYIPKSATASFTSYQKDGFNAEKHKQVVTTMQELTDKGVYVMACNNNIDIIYELYKDFTIDPVNVRRSINRNGHDRKGKEVIITNF